MMSTTKPKLDPPSMEAVFGETGIIATALSNYEFRPGQVAMADAVLNAFDKKRHLIVEAGTGTGKTLAYLVPAIATALARKQRIIISTGTKNLQEQLMEKDIPFLQDVLPTKFTAAYMKGRTNFACLYRIKKAESQPILENMEELDSFSKISSWSRESATGDRAELTDLPENLSFWNQINAKSETCLGSKCEDFEACFITRMRKRADEADIVIVNHHLFFADLNLRGNEFGRVIPDYGAVIFDEAHLIEDIASDYFGFNVSNFQLEELVRDVDRLPIADAQINRDLMRVGVKVIGFADIFWARFAQARGQEGRFPLLPNSFGQKFAGDEMRATPLGEAYIQLDAALKQLEAILDRFAAEDTEIESVLKRSRQICFDLNFIATQAEKNFVYWLERRGRGVFLRASPIDVSELLQEKLFEKVETVVLTSATLSSKGNFNFIKERLGLSNAKTDSLIAPSSFDHESQMILYLPRTMPDPRAPEFTQLAAGEIVKILNATKGRAFVLCTSIASMNALHMEVARRVEFSCFVQGSMSKTGLLERFKSTPNAVLFATSSFWQGVDVRGEQLSCVIIDKLPFAVPSDPIVAARSRFIEENGGSSFNDYSVPQAIITLKQGIGRLIRSATDKGVIAILDPRLRTKNYGRDFLNSLPKCNITNDVNEIAEIFDVGDFSNRATP